MGDADWPDNTDPHRMFSSKPGAENMKTRLIGIPPKLYARIVRFEAALRRKAAVPESRWTDIAHSLGYHDQMHMVHDFNRLSGDSPTAIGGQLDMFVQPEVDSAHGHASSPAPNASAHC